MNMSMFIHFGDREIILFSFWKTGSFWGLAVSLLITFLLCFVHEGIKGARILLAQSHNMNRRRQAAIRGNSSIGDNISADSVTFAPLLNLNGFTKRLFTKYRIIQAALYGLQVLLAFVLMLIAMTFNGYLIICIVVAESIGYFLFSGTPIVDGGNDCC
ncbi:unnamed protein product [Auanema sp. JU1783]|nr:unnamed protein product [Auanema sp. JU1783]